METSELENAVDMLEEMFRLEEKVSGKQEREQEKVQSRPLPEGWVYSFNRQKHSIIM